MSTQADRPTVLIVGAGLGGLMLGALLEKADISYVIFERSSSVKPLGSAIMVGPNLMGLFEQMNIDEEFKAIGKPTFDCVIGKDDMEVVCKVDFRHTVEYTGYCNYIVGRPALYNLLLRQIPPHKVLFNKRVLKIADTEEGVHISTTDKSTYEGDILVGADGAYSAVRQRMYETLKAAGTLPKSDQEDLPFKSTCLVGQTKPIDFAAAFPEFLDESGPFYCTLSKTSPYTWTVFPTINGNLCWMVMHHLDKESSKAAEEHRFRESDNSQWGSHAAQAMCDETRHFILPFGTKKATMGDLYDLTPQDRISKVMLEEKVFQTWYSGRTVLLGDACHKLNPSGAHGAVTAMHDALALANLIYALPNKTSVAIEEAFSEYQAERIGPVTASYNASKALSMVIGRGPIGAIALFLRKYTPLFIWDTVIVNKKKAILDRPTAGFLRKVRTKGTVPPTVSPSGEKARKVFEQRTRAVSV
ncbi:FAD/NAD(P)-binding domain-containing protein [Linnemannia elongata AG-77]|uniref:FAD/NAD(P)-binding domain-containing protein n=1 Tax=Linnemannia elongata AG-77 TaxID=1314771 RepID=A0A197K7F1_9FUNG|nr:FAD/NAD(P)-binding domain-containing protein [Linnemannia elongata AG-77]